jgi:hypothetical protein
MPLCRSSRRASGLVRWFGGAPSVMQGLIPDWIAEGTTTVGVPWWIYRSPAAAFRLGPWTRPGGQLAAHAMRLALMPPSPVEHR